MASKLDVLEIALSEYENDETPTRRELAMVKRKLAATEQALELANGRPSEHWAADEQVTIEDGYAALAAAREGEDA